MATAVELALIIPSHPDYGVDMSKHPDRDADITHNRAERDPLAEVYSELASPDIAEMNEHAAALEKASEPEPENL